MNFFREFLFFLSTYVTAKYLKSAHILQPFENLEVLGKTLKVSAVFHHAADWCLQQAYPSSCSYRSSILMYPGFFPETSMSRCESKKLIRDLRAYNK